MAKETAASNWGNPWLLPQGSLKIDRLTLVACSILFSISAQGFFPPVSMISWIVCPLELGYSHPKMTRDNVSTPLGREASQRQAGREPVRLLQ